MSKRYFMAVAAALMVFLSVPAVPSHAAAKGVSVTLPNSPVTINGTVVNNSNRSYPFIVYRDITYFPMTYYDCRFLGLETKWDAKSGLAITKTGVTGTYKDYAGSQNQTSYPAAVASFPIKVNGTAVNNSKEEYPLLTFRDVTYFPMSWKFAVDSFGWKYDFDKSKGLTINSVGSKAEKIGGLGMAKSYSSYLPAKGYLYCYEDGNIVAINYANPSDKKVLRKPEENQDRVQSARCGDGLYFRATDSSDRSVPFGPAPGVTYYVDTSKRELQVIPDDTVILGDIQVTVANFQGNSMENLSVKLADGTVRKIGDPKLHYEMDIYNNMIQNSSIERKANDLFLFAADENRSYVLCRVDIQTGANTVLAKNVSIQSGFSVDGGYVYAIGTENHEEAVEEKMVRISLADGKTEYFGTKTSGGMFNNGVYGVLNGKLYYRNGWNMDRPPMQAGPDPNYEEVYNEWLADRFKYDEELYLVGTSTSLSPETRVQDIYRSGDYMVVQFEWNNDKTQEDSKYTLMVFDRDGKAVFKTADTVFYAEVDGSNLIYGVNRSETGQADYYKASLK